jgi:hypothetical protein
VVWTELVWTTSGLVMIDGNGNKNYGIVRMSG